MINYFRRGTNLRSRLCTYLMAFCAVFITIAMVVYPKDAFESAMTGLNLWWNVVFPALLPFFILSEILMGLGVVHFIGVLLEPLMRPLFNVPGVGAFALSMGLASGYPMDAVITSKFRQKGMCSSVEAERLLSFTNTADPLFMFGAVAVGMFAMPELGVIIALAHYISSFLVGFIFRFYGRSRDHIQQDLPINHDSNILVRAFRSLYRARREDNRPIGQLFGDSVKNSMNTILLIGGFIILFAVFIRILSVAGVTESLENFFAAFLSLIGFNSNLAGAMVNGLLEIDLGTMAASQANAPLTQKAAIASAVIAWSGLSVHGQVASIVIQSGIRMGPYMLARLIHAILAATLTLLFIEPMEALLPLLAIPTFTSQSIPWLSRIESGLYVFLLILGILVCLSLILNLFKQLTNLKRVK